VARAGIEAALYVRARFGPKSGMTGDKDPKSKGYLSFDGVHPKNTEHKIIADEPRKLGCAPLR
jgi:hypothetical protein